MSDNAIKKVEKSVNALLETTIESQFPSVKNKTTSKESKIPLKCFIVVWRFFSLKVICFFSKIVAMIKKIAATDIVTRICNQPRNEYSREVNIIINGNQNIILYKPYFESTIKKSSNLNY